MFVDFATDDNGTPRSLRVNPNQVAAFVEVSAQTTLLILVGGKEFTLAESAQRVQAKLEAAYGPVLV
ncbi:hypothetical protein [Rhizobium sp. S163]|uniref:hypothetical protein n=1 Tax=Rhizobium sp. S163 TaxID=3055039 RepID=UPI000DDD9FE7|nr:hypothetical protein [Rhizobium sp. S163]MDM9645375.1 hypothetical protein [Rhizobium sp. S163]